MKKIIAVTGLFISLGFAGFSKTMQIGAFDPSNWHGVVMVRDGLHFAFRFIMEKDGQPADGYDTFYLVEDVGPRAPLGIYSSMTFTPRLPFGKAGETPIPVKNSRENRLFRVEYSRWGDGVVGRLHIPRGIQCRIHFYNPWTGRLKYRFRQGRIRTEPDSEFQFFAVQGRLNRPENGDELGVSVDPVRRSFYFYAGFGNPDLTSGRAEGILDAQLRAYSRKRPRAAGEWSGLIRAITHNLSWMVLWQPEPGRRYLPAGRRWIFPGPDGKRDTWTIFEWDAFFNALEATVEDFSLAADEITAVLATQYPWGNIPNWRSARNGSPDRSQPPVGAFAVWKIYLKTGDLSILRGAYEPLKKFHEFWTSPEAGDCPRRDGNANGLLEWGSDTHRIPDGVPDWEVGASGRQRAAWESGQDDLPNYDDVPFDQSTGTLMMDCIDLNALYALDTQMLRNIARALGKKKDSQCFDAEYEMLKRRINRTLFRASMGFYFDRFWSGEYSSHKAASNFYPLIAGIPDHQQARRIVERLLDTRQFWGDYVIPTISRDNPAFGDQQYWRGTIWPPTNYLVYQGLKRYKFDEVAARFAVKSARLFLKSWREFRLCRENYNSITGAGGGQRYQSWGPLFALILLEEFIDYCPFGGFRVGNLAAEKETRLENIRLRDRLYRIIADKKSLYLWRDGRQVIGYRGRGVIRELEIRDRVIAGNLHVVSDTLTLDPRIFENSPYRAEIGGKETTTPGPGPLILEKGWHQIRLAAGEIPKEEDP